LGCRGKETVKLAVGLLDAHKFERATMRLLCALYERWCELSALTKFKLTVMGIGLLIGLPTSAMGLVWHEMRVALQVSNCSDDLTKPMLDALLQADGDAVLRATGAQKIEQSRECAAGALQHPKGTVAFLLDEHRRLANAAH